MTKIKHKPGLLWITGLSGSGKTTISKIIYNKLKKKILKYNSIRWRCIKKKIKS